MTLPKIELQLDSLQFRNRVYMWMKKETMFMAAYQ
jgi:hypothetical protein